MLGNKVGRPRGGRKENARVANNVARHSKRTAELIAMGMEGAAASRQAYDEIRGIAKTCHRCGGQVTTVVKESALMGTGMVFENCEVCGEEYNPEKRRGCSIKTFGQIEKRVVKARVQIEALKDVIRRIETEINEYKEELKTMLAEEDPGKTLLTRHGDYMSGDMAVCPKCNRGNAMLDRGEYSDREERYLNFFECRDCGLKLRFDDVVVRHVLFNKETRQHDIQGEIYGFDREGKRVPLTNDDFYIDGATGKVKIIPKTKCPDCGVVDGVHFVDCKLK